MTVRCKFYCSEKTERYDGYTKAPVYDYKFYAVTNGSEENKQFWKYTPGGNLVVSSIKTGLFEPGKEYYLDLSAAEAAPVEATQ